MPRPCKKRRISFKPEITFFKPAGVPIRDIKEVVLNPDEIQAIKLCDNEGLDQRVAAERLQVSQSTFNRILSRARKKIGQALIMGYSIKLMKE